jgi:hypothetical protein
MEALGLTGTNYSFNDIEAELIQGLDDDALKDRMTKIVDIVESFMVNYRVLDRYRLSVMNRDLDAGKELNDDIKGWRAKRY